MYKKIILSHLLDYIRLKEIPFKKCGATTMVKCPYCNDEKLTGHLIPNIYKVRCYKCTTEFNIIDLAKKFEGFSDSTTEEEYLYRLKELLNINVITKKDNDDIQVWLNYYIKNGFDLVPIVKNDKIPAEKEWTIKIHKTKEEWENWLVSGLNIGIKTGTNSNVTIIDIDQKPIPEEIKTLMGNTLIQESSKGYHLFYKYVEELPKTRIDDLKIDIENKGGQVVIYPSIVKEVQRKYLNTNEIIEMPKEFKEFLLTKVSVPIKTFSEKIREDIETEDFKINPEDLKLINSNLDGCCNSSFVKLGGILRKGLNVRDTGYVLQVLNKHLLENPMDSKAINSMIESLDKYTSFDEKELAHKILEYLKQVEEANRTEIAMSIVGTNRGEDKKRADIALNYLVREDFIAKKGNRYLILKKAEWKENLVNEGKAVDFKVPYFNEVANFNFGDLILVGSKNKKGKTHISMNMVKQLVDQGKKPYYISLETGSRFTKIALQLGLKEGDFKWAFHSDPTLIELEPNAITIIDWLLIVNKAETDLIFKHFIEQLDKNGGFLIIFMQLKDDNTWFAPNMANQFPSLSAKYIYDKDDDGEFGKFEIKVVREPKLNNKWEAIPCKYDWETKLLTKIEDNIIPPSTETPKDTFDL